jgi:hypothetical protein
MDTFAVTPSADVLAAIDTLKTNPAGASDAIAKASNEAASQLVPNPPQMGGNPTADQDAQTLTRGLVDASTDASAVLPEVVNQQATAQTNFRKIFLAALFVAAAGVPAAKAGREMMVADAELPFRTELFQKDCAASANNTATIQELSMKATLAASSPLASFMNPGLQAETTVALDHARKVQSALQQACSSSEAGFTIAVAAVTAARTAFTNATYSWLTAALATAGITIAGVMSAANEAARGNTTPLAAMVNEAEQVQPAVVAAPPVVLGQAPSAPAPAPARRSRAGRRTYRKAKRAGRTRKSRR